MKMCQALALAGHEVVLFARHEPSCVCPFEYYGVSPVFSIKYLPWRDVIGAGAIYRLYSGWLVKRLGFDFALGRGLVACFVAASLGISTVFETHTPIQNRGRLNEFLFRLLIRLKAFRFVIVITEALRKEVIRATPELEHRILVFPDGADSMARDVEPYDLRKKTSRLQIGYTGHLYKGKGAEVMLALAIKCPQFDFHLVGGAEEDLTIWRSRPDLPDNLELHGYKPHNQILSYLVAFDIALLPNQRVVTLQGDRGDIGKWTSPLKLFEYMAAGCAIICSDIPVLQEIAKDRVNVILCRHDSVSDWKDAVEELASDPELRAAIGQRARFELESYYSWDKRARAILDHITVS